MKYFFIVFVSLVTLSSGYALTPYSEVFTPGKVIDIPTESTLIIVTNVSLAYKGLDGYVAPIPRKMIPYDEGTSMIIFDLRGILPGSMDVVGPDGAMRVNIFDVLERERRFAITAELETIRKEKTALEAEIVDYRKRFFILENLSAQQAVTIAGLETVIKENQTSHDLMRQEDVERMLEAERALMSAEFDDRQGHPVWNLIKFVVGVLVIVLLVASAGYWFKSQGRH